MGEKVDSERLKAPQEPMSASKPGDLSRQIVRENFGQAAHTTRMSALEVINSETSQRDRFALFAQRLFLADQLARAEVASRLGVESSKHRLQDLRCQLSVLDQQSKELSSHSITSEAHTQELDTKTVQDNGTGFDGSVRFLELPLEIRLVIYKIIISKSETREPTNPVRRFHVTKKKKSSQMLELPSSHPSEVHHLPPNDAQKFRSQHLTKRKFSLHPIHVHSLLLTNRTVRSEFLPFWYEDCKGTSLHYTFYSHDMTKYSKTAIRKSNHPNLNILGQTLQRLSREELSLGLNLTSLTFVEKLSDNDTSTTSLLSQILTIAHALHPHLHFKTMATPTITFTTSSDIASPLFCIITPLDATISCSDTKQPSTPSLITTSFLSFAACIPPSEMQEEKQIIFALADFLNADEKRVRGLWLWRALWKECLGRVYGSLVAKAMTREWTFLPCEIESWRDVVW